MPNKPEKLPDELGEVTHAAAAADSSSRARVNRERRERWERLRLEARGAGMSGKDAIAHANRAVDNPPDANSQRAGNLPPERGVSGLGDIPADWPELPPNASLQAEVSWVQANRLRVVDGDTVDLTRALSPAPSHAALGWLETSIRAYSMYCQVVAKATSTQEHEAQQVKRERMRIDDVRSLLAEMLPTGLTCPTCGQAIEEK